MRKGSVETTFLILLVVAAIILVVLIALNIKLGDYASLGISKLIAAIKGE